MCLSLSAELSKGFGAAIELYTVTSKMCYHFVLDHGQAYDHRIIGRVRCRNYDDITLSSTILTGSMTFNHSFVILVINIHRVTSLPC